ncbi:SDR family NAD(P)-dependent oxidoreductase [Streptomyces sp. M41(2017)]|uniref:SDR family NAD(P)-dependent oxidoreductase n=1 Tax=Streptomyces sp. M41(2017) TaxID=1955065 RepID=UPI001F4F00C6|nr:SDR family NAD(P)-dependent oxidoreductase [Streptomyces sp. M41(2017)]
MVVHNAAHLLVGYTAAFTADDIAHLFDVNVLGAQRINRAVLPHLRARRAGTLLYVGSTTSVIVPPFLGPYVASKSAFDALAQVTSYEANHFGIETVIVMPGRFTQGTEHFPNSGRASDTAVTAQYAELDDLVARNEDATNGLFDPHTTRTRPPSLTRSPVSSPCRPARSRRAAWSTSHTAGSRRSTTWR